MEITESKVSYTATFEEAKLDPRDCVVVSKISSIGKMSMQEAFNILYPNQYQIVELNEGFIEFAMVRKTTIEQLSEDRIIDYIKKRASKLLKGAQAGHVDFAPVIIDTIIH